MRRFVWQTLVALAATTALAGSAPNADTKAEPMARLRLARSLARRPAAAAFKSSRAARSADSRA